MSIRKGDDVLASKAPVDANPTQGSTNAVSSGGVYTALQGKLNRLTAGTNITISGSTISAKDTTYTAGENITIESTGVDDYTLLEYIQSNGTQYIDTGISGLDSGNWVIYVKWMQTAAPTTSYSYIAGAYNSESHNAYRIITKQTSASSYYVNGNSAAGNGSVLADNYAANVVHQGYIRNGSVTIDSTTYSTPTQGTAIPSGVHIYLLGNSTLGKTTCKLYESWATQNGFEKYHYYPAIRNSDNAVGMYDTVGQRFVAATAGTFAAGPVKSDGFVIKGKNWSVADLTDTTISSATNGDLLKYDGSKWVNAQVPVNDSTITLSQGGVTKGSFTLNQASGATIDFDAGNSALAGLSDVAISTPAVNQVLQYNGTKWANANMPSAYHPDLFDWKWADHICNDVQWLRADTFSWQSGSVYEAAFNELFYDIQISTYWYGSGGPAYTKSRTPAVGDAVYLNSDLTTQIGTVEAYDDVNDEITVSGDTYSYMSNTYVTPTTETVAGYTVTVYTGHSGKKIVGAGDESNVANIYTATGVAWYYIIDIPNKRFKLPRTQYGVTGLRDTVGNYVAAGLPNITGSLGDTWYTFGGSRSGAFTAVSGTTHSPTNANNSTGAYTTNFDASASNSIYGNSTTVQPNATQMYLYFYVGEFTQTALENTAGLNAELFNDKVDVGHQVIAFQEPTALNNYTWYRKYADGWVEQGGINTTAGISICTLVIEMADTNYQVLTTQYKDQNTATGGAVSATVCVRSTVNFYITKNYGNTTTPAGDNCYWQVSGIAA